MDSVAKRLDDIRERMVRACVRAGRPADSARLIAVSKTFAADRLAEAADTGQQDFGESYVQEAIAKIDRVETQAARRLCWHFIGPIQGNKTAAIAMAFRWAHGLDRLKIAQRLSAQRRDDQPPLNVCVQVNISDEISKAGCAPADAAALCAAISTLPGLRLRGLMCIPEAVDEAEQARSGFRALRLLHLAINRAGVVDPTHFDTLSMGMSSDFEVAIEEGATLIRVGSAIFGTRIGN